MKAYVLIKGRAGTGNTIVQAMRQLAGVREAHLTFGPYDVIATVETTSLEALGTLVAESIQTIAGVLDTLTCLVIE